MLIRDTFQINIKTFKSGTCPNQGEGVLEGLPIQMFLNVNFCSRFQGEGGSRGFKSGVPDLKEDEIFPDYRF